MRRSDWPERLAAVIDSARETPFQWGTHDCCLFVCNCIAAIFEIDPAENFRGRYDTRTGAYKRMSEFVGGGAGAGDLVEATAKRICRHYGASVVPPATAGRGDVVLLNDAHGDMLGIVWSGAIYVVAEDGLTTRPLSAIERAWRF